MKLVYGFGLNDADYMVYSRVNGKVVVCGAYTAWLSMLARSFSKSYQDKFPTYVGVTVCDEWRSFMKFRKWWMEHKVDGWQLDKDLLTDKKTYSPDTCIYIPSWLNKFTTGRKASRGEFPIGVSLDKQTGRFVARCHNTKSGKSEFIGSFENQFLANEAWRTKKLEIADQLKQDMDSIDGRLHGRIVEIILRMQ